MLLPSISQLAIPGVSVLIAFLAYSSQLLFQRLDPSPLDQTQTLWFNCSVICIWICYARACWTDPGHIPSEWTPTGVEDVKTRSCASSRQRWCRKCEALKPPRAHHCKICNKCIPKMDHHCPWTANCVSIRTFPHFIRFLFYAVLSMMYLEYFLYIRATFLWQKRDLPSYLGPSAGQLIHLFLLVTVNSITLFALLVLFIRSLWSLGSNTTTIEGWEIERHKALLRRSRVLGGYLDGPDGTKVNIKRQEFPYDIGIWRDIKQGMGGNSNILGWFWPFAFSPSNMSGLEFEVNGFEDSSVSWPPPDPDRIPRVPRSFDPGDAFIHQSDSYSDKIEVGAFRKRQQEDMMRFQSIPSKAYRRVPFHDRYSSEKDNEDLEGSDGTANGSSGGEEGWRNSEGDRLRDFGVDEDAEFYDEDDIPLSELLQRRKEVKVSIDRSIAMGRSD